MKIDINLLKENPKEFKAYNKIMLEDEKQRNFLHDQDIVDPNSYDVVDSSFPFIRKGFKWWFKQKFYNAAVRIYSKKINKELTNLKVIGKENLKGLKSCIVTCNHISKVDSFAVRGALKEDIMYVAADHNNWKGYMGDLARNTGFLPISTKNDLVVMREFTKAIKYYLDKNKKILIYPEQAMWREYKKPRPLQIGAFHYAVMNDVPVLPLFITIEDKKEKIDANGRQNFGDYTIHILPPIYPNKLLDNNERKKDMQERNYNAWVEVYEKVYKKKLKY